MNDLTPSYEPETGQVIVDGRPAGPAGEAGLVPVAGVDLAFDRSDGCLIRASVESDDASVTTLLTRLFGPQAPAVLQDVAAQARVRPSALTPEPGLCTALSRLARLDAARATSPVPGSSPWWAAEAAVLAERAGMHPRALAEAHRAVRALGGGPVAVPGEVARVALAAADIAADDDEDAVLRLRESIIVASRPDQPRTLGLNVAAEVEGLAKDCVRLPGLQWALDPGLVPDGLFRPGLSPHSDLRIRHDSSGDCVTVQATLVPGADATAVGRCQARLVDPAVRRVLARAGFEQAGSRVKANLHLPFSLDELGETWVEVVGRGDRPVRSSRAHRIRRALRWADAALRAERAPAGIAPQSATADWAALAAAAWERCRRDWEAAGDPDRAAAVLTPRVPLPDASYLAEVLGE
jgi:hypothetical protein